MDAAAEQLIGLYLTRGGKVFIVPQFPVPSDKPGQDWSCPDFVALNFEDGKREVVVVEVSTASNINTLLKKVRERETQWYERTRCKLIQDSIITADWTMRFIGFVRKDNVDKARTTFSGEQGVHFEAIEDVSFPWAYWEDRRGGGLPETIGSPLTNQS